MAIPQNQKSFALRGKESTLLRDPNGVSSHFCDFRPYLRGWDAPRTYPRSTEIFQQGSPADRLCYIERGLIKLTAVEPEGGEVIVGLRRRNWMLAASAVILQARYSATATTLTQCTLRSTSGERFLNQLHNDIGLSMEINRMLSREIQNHLTSLRHFGCMNAMERLGRFLAELIIEEDCKGEALSRTLEIPLKNHELAQIIGVTAEHTCRLLRKMEGNGLVRRTRSKLVIIRPRDFLHVTGDN